jgi:hypothetical protein
MVSEFIGGRYKPGYPSFEAEWKQTREISSHQTR